MSTFFYKKIEKVLHKGYYCLVEGVLTMTIGERIKERREELELSQEDLAKRLGLRGRSSVSKAEKSGDAMTTKTINAYANALRCSPAYLLGFEEELTEENANFSVDILEDKTFLDYAKKLFYASETVKSQVYSYIDFLLR